MDIDFYYLDFDFNLVRRDLVFKTFTNKLTSQYTSRLSKPTLFTDSIKQNYKDLCAQFVDVKEFLFRKICSLRNKVTSYKQQIDHVIDKLLIIKELKTNHE